MKITNEVPVSASIQETWQALLDVPRIARALPGASIEPDLVDGAYRGTMKIKLGPVSAEYAGVARLQDSDEDDHIASFHVQGREVRGQGTAEATITIRVSAGADVTRLEVETDLQVTGRQAQIGRGIMEEVAAGVLREFAARLQRAIVGSEAIPGGDAEDVFDAGRAVYRPLLERGAILLVGVLVGLGLAHAARRR